MIPRKRNTISFPLYIYFIFIYIGNPFFYFRLKISTPIKLTIIESETFRCDVVADLKLWLGRPCLMFIRIQDITVDGLTK